MEGALSGAQRHGRDPVDPDLVAALLAAAGRAGPWTIESIATVGWINTNAVVALPDGERVVVRRYDWPFDVPARFDRAAKEAWIHPLLAAAGVPVAEVLATAAVAGRSAALLEWLPGEPLGVVAQRVDGADLADAWRGAGAALRAAHDAAIPCDAGAGFLTAGGQVLPFPGETFGGFHRTRLADYVPRAAAELPRFAIDPDQIAALVEQAVPLVDAHRPRLGHSDAHPWNVLVAPDGTGRWTLSGWLDWEFAWMGDPAWDIVRMQEQRFAPIGPVPAAWWEGYGPSPTDVAVALATLHFMFWKAVDVDDTRDREVAHRWLADLPDHLERLAELVG